MLYKMSTKMTLNSKQNRQKTQNTERRKTKFLKDYVENADLHISVLNKVITTHEECKNSIS